MKTPTTLRARAAEALASSNRWKEEKEALDRQRHNASLRSALALLGILCEPSDNLIQLEGVWFCYGRDPFRGKGTLFCSASADMFAAWSITTLADIGKFYENIDKARKAATIEG